MKDKKIDIIGNIIVFILLTLLLIAGYFSYKSIDWNVLKNLESHQIILPTPIPATSSAQINNNIPTASDSSQSSINKKP